MALGDKTSAPAVKIRWRGGAKMETMQTATTNVPSSLDSRTIFRSAPARPSARATVRGAVPEWLCGDLVRTAPACFALGGWRAAHWFDGLGLIYAFRLDGEVRFEQRVLESEARRRIEGGFDDTPHFGTPMKRAFFDRLFHPVPRPNDNTNVHVLPLGGELVAMTETTVQHVIDRASLRVSGQVSYADAHGDLFMLAHPHADFARGAVVNVATELGARSGLVVYEHPFASRSRTIVGRVRSSEVPYLHSFGLTERHAVLLGGPYTVTSWRLLWSDRGYVDHFRWQPEHGTTIDLVDRGSGEVRRHRAPAMFVFHTINTFERGDETVHDVLAYDDAAIVERLSVDRLGDAGLPDLRPRPTRLVMRPGVEDALVEPLADFGFEFPGVDYRRFAGRDYRVAFGAENGPEKDGYVSSIVRLDVATGAKKALREPGFVFGEPVFVGRPGGSGEGDGVLLSVASHASEDRAALAIVDAASLDVVAWCEVPLPIPLGFHGSFVRAAR